MAHMYMAMVAKKNYEQGYSTDSLENVRKFVSGNRKNKKFVHKSPKNSVQERTVRQFVKKNLC